MLLGDIIAERRKKMGLNQEKFAEQINSSRVSVSQWENNKCLPDTTTLISIAKFYQCSIDELLNPIPSPAAEDRQGTAATA